MVYLFKNWIWLIFAYWRLDEEFVLKISDFGLSEDVYARNYFKQQRDNGIKLPVKWMAPESLQDGIFSEKSDVVSFIVSETGTQWLRKQ